MDNLNPVIEPIEPTALNGNKPDSTKIYLSRAPNSPFIRFSYSNSNSGILDGILMTPTELAHAASLVLTPVEKPLPVPPLRVGTDYEVYKGTGLRPLYLAPEAVDRIYTSLEEAYKYLATFGEDPTDDYNCYEWAAILRCEDGKAHGLEFETIFPPFKSRPTDSAPIWSACAPITPRGI